MKGMSVIVKTIASWVKILVILFGVYIILFGHLTPGGGFAGGVIIAGSYILLMLAFGKDFVQENFTIKLASKLDSVGAIMFAVIALLGFLYGGGMFFYNFIYQNFQADSGLAGKLISAGTIPLSNIAIGVKVSASLFLMVTVLSAFRIEKSPDNDKE